MCASTVTSCSSEREKKKRLAWPARLVHSDRVSCSTSPPSAPSPSVHSPPFALNPHVLDAARLRLKSRPPVHPTHPLVPPLFPPPILHRLVRASLFHPFALSFSLSFRTVLPSTYSSISAYARRDEAPAASYRERSMSPRRGREDVNGGRSPQGRGRSASPGRGPRMDVDRGRPQ